MRNIEDLFESGKQLHEAIIQFKYQAGMFDSRLALNLERLLYEMQPILDYIEEIALEHCIATKN